MQLEAVAVRSPGLRPVVIELPENGDMLIMGYAPVDITLDSVEHVAVAAGAVSVTWNLRYATTKDESGGAGSDVWAANQVTSTKAGASITTFTNGVIPAGNWVWLEVRAAPTGSPSQFAAIAFVAGLR